MKTPFRLFPATVLLALLPLGFLAVMVVAPLVAMAAYDGSAWSLVVTDDYMQHRLVWTVVQAAGTCVLVLLLGIPVGWSLARLSFRGREMILRLYKISTSLRESYQKQGKSVEEARTLANARTKAIMKERMHCITPI
ncbi:ABC transporter, permease protein [Neisseria sicca ATCC 29256]|uniref:ABC transporter, permease protein n=1 Tax=Neisseria sicca ATCC 29256 TaxID=547045 RepID=C6M5Z1_NEISI|nr:ABC transporter, permease protein [Neisseria sicca ATCC 29256]